MIAQPLRLTPKHTKPNAINEATPEGPKVNWQRRYFKGKKVWVQVDDDGELVVENGRVPMRYQNSENAKIYNANPRNVSSKTADQIESKDSSSRSSGTKSRSKGLKISEPAGPLRQSQSVPDDLCEVPEPQEGIVEIHTDGACSGNPGPCGYGAIIREGFDYLELSQYLGRGTNNIAELTAIKIALESVEDKTKPVRLYTDSSYSIGVLTKGWKARANRELILSIRDLIDEFDDLQILKVKGHAGDPLNERADDLATGSLQDRRK